MAVVSLSELKRGMILAKPVFNRQGNLLLGEGCEIGESHLSLFAAWGVREADIQDAKKEETDDLAMADFSQEVVASIDRKLEERFSEVMGGEVMMEVMRVVRKQLLKRKYTSEL